MSEHIGNKIDQVARFINKHYYHIKNRSINGVAQIRAIQDFSKDSGYYVIHLRHNHYEYLYYYPAEGRWCPRSDIEILEEITDCQDSTVSFLDKG